MKDLKIHWSAVRLGLNTTETEKHVLHSCISELTSVNCFFQTILETSACQRTKLNELASAVCVSLCRGGIKQTFILLETHRSQISPARSVITAGFITALSENPVWTKDLCLTLRSHAEASHWLTKIYQTAL